MEKELKTTNYYDAFIEVAEDCRAETGTIPPQKEDKKSIARIEYDMLIDNPYRYTSDEVLFEVHAIRNNIPDEDREKERMQFFSKGQACFRASPLTKTYGWGVHFDSKGAMALYGRNSEPYKKLAADEKIQHFKAVRSKRA